MQPGERGFTLVELMVVIGIVTILVMLAVPAFLGARRGAQDRHAQVTAVLAAKTALIQGVDGSFDDVTIPTLEAMEPSITFVAGTVASTSPAEASAYSPDLAATFVIAAWSRTQTCFFVRDVANQGRSFARLENTPAASCSADEYVTVPPGAWSDSW